MMTKSIIRLTQDDYKFVARFNHKERAEERAALYRKLGHEAEVVPLKNSQGVIDFAVYEKIKEV